jgi:hypothetical protein
MIRVERSPVGAGRVPPTHLAIVLLISALVGFTVNRATASKDEGCVQDIVFTAREVERIPIDPDQWKTQYDPGSTVLFRTNGSPDSAQDGFYEPRITDIDDDFSLSWVGTP